MRLVLIPLAYCAMMISAAPGEAQLRGHGGPVRALAISADGATALSGSFDTSAIRWSLQNDAAGQVLRFHEGAVNAVAILKDGRLATAGEEGRIAIWTPGRPAPDTILEGHRGPVAALAVSPDGAAIASASWDRTIRLWPLSGGRPRVLEGNLGNVNGVAFAPDGKAVISAGYDATLRIWPLDRESPPLTITLPAPLNAVVAAPGGEIMAAGADGKVYFFSNAGEQRGVVEAAAAPITSLSITASGGLIAAASIGGPIALIDSHEHTIVRRLTGSGLPAWSTAFFPDGRTLLTGGADHVIRRWDLETGKPFAAAGGNPEDPLAEYAGDPGAQVFRACVACHTLKPDAGNRAGPTLHGIFGRRIASLPAYNFSEALKHLDIVWTPDTLTKLFQIGPARYTPGTKMPEQRLGSADLEALIRFLERAAK